jgi:hypothetical protein
VHYTPSLPLSAATNPDKSMPQPAENQEAETGGLRNRKIHHISSKFTTFFPPSEPALARQWELQKYSSGLRSRNESPKTKRAVKIPSVQRVGPMALDFSL